jgi:hypothetical protein
MDLLDDLSQETGNASGSCQKGLSASERRAAPAVLLAGMSASVI